MKVGQMVTAVGWGTFHQGLRKEGTLMAIKNKNLIVSFPSKYITSNIGEDFDLVTLREKNPQSPHYGWKLENDNFYKKIDIECKSSLTDTTQIKTVSTEFIESFGVNNIILKKATKVYFVNIIEGDEINKYITDKDTIKELKILLKGIYDTSKKYQSFPNRKTKYINWNYKIK